MICVHLYTQTVVVTASARRASPMSKAVHPLRLTKTRHVEYLPTQHYYGGLPIVCLERWYGFTKEIIGGGSDRRPRKRRGVRT
jgi:hypothetical protein